MRACFDGGRVRQGTRRSSTPTISTTPTPTPEVRCVRCCVAALCVCCVFRSKIFGRYCAVYARCLDGKYYGTPCASGGSCDSELTRLSNESRDTVCTVAARAEWCLLGDSRVPRVLRVNTSSLCLIDTSPVCARALSRCTSTLPAICRAVPAVHGGAAVVPALHLACILTGSCACTPSGVSIDTKSQRIITARLLSALCRLILAFLYRGRA